MKKRILALVTVAVLVAMTVLPAASAATVSEYCAVHLFPPGNYEYTNIYTIYIDATTHRAYYTEVRSCYFCGELGEFESKTVIEAHNYSILVRDIGHLNGSKFHEYRARCVCGHEATKGKICPGPPCQGIFSVPDQIS